MEVLSRAYWSISHEVSFFDALEVEHSFYRNLATIEPLVIERDDDVLDVLLLGASVLTPTYGEVPGALERALASRWDGPVRIHSLAKSGQMSRDSLNKYRRLADKRFDAVLIYHSVNDIRTNNAPRDRFRADYTHMDWYRQANFAIAHVRLSRFTTLPFTGLALWLTLKDLAGLHPSIGPIRPVKEYLKYGADVKSAAALEANLREILRLARERGDPVVLTSYAWYVPEDYSYQLFKERALDYRYEKRFVPLEVWGEPENVIRGLRQHNQVLRRLGETGLATRFVDLEAAIPKQGRYFSDACHLSAEGSELFAELVAPALLEARLSRVEDPQGI
jgi:lysophospholipase L1-like esterase